MGNKVFVEHSDITTFPCDVIVLKYARAFFGADKMVASLLTSRVSDPPLIAPLPGDHVLLPSKGETAAPYVLFLGVVDLYSFEYEQIREFASSSLKILAREMPDVRHVAMTIHGMGYGLDEREAFLAQVGGLLDALREGDAPASLERITIVERGEARAKRLGQILKNNLTTRPVMRSGGAITKRAAIRGALPSKPTIDAGITSSAKPHVFIAMPFSEEMEDTYVFGIQGPVNAAGYLCERVDMATFTGDILARVKSRIESASLIVADLTGSNPNVYLEVGYAWGKDRPTLLVAKKGEELKFDVRGQRCIVYKNIADLARQLAEDLAALSQQDS